MVVNLTNDVGETPLHYACIFGNLDIIDYLLESGADINAKTKTNDTPLFYAATKGHLHVIKHFLDSKEKYKIDINHQNDSGETAILIACKKGYIEMIKYLIEKNVDLSCKSEDGSNLLHFVICMNNIEIVKLVSERMNVNSIL